MFTQEVQLEKERGKKRHTTLTAVPSDTLTCQAPGHSVWQSLNPWSRRLWDRGRTPVAGETATAVKSVRRWLLHAMWNDFTGHFSTATLRNVTATNLDVHFLVDVFHREGEGLIPCRVEVFINHLALVERFPIQFEFNVRITCTWMTTNDKWAHWYWTLQWLLLQLYC